MLSKKRVLVTGAAGFIGFHTSCALLQQDWEVFGIDNLNDYYDPNLKKARLKEINKQLNSKYFSFEQIDLADSERLLNCVRTFKPSVIVNLAAQAGVRYSIENPKVYLKSNIDGFLNILEAARYYNVENLIYASSSSVYGKNKKLPFSEDDRVDHPISLYAATKKSNELMAHVYSELFSIPTTGLRFFTVYGPWGRPDMAMFIFADAILNEKPFRLFNNGDMYRDFTYVSDIVESVVRLCTNPAKPNTEWDAYNPETCSSSVPFRIYNIGNHSPVRVGDLVSLMEKLLEKKAKIISDVIQPGDVSETYADVHRLAEAVGFKPNTPIETGVKNFLSWYREYHSI